MVKETISRTFGKGHKDLDGQLPGSLFAILRELRGLRFNIVSGAAANTDITLTGISTEDTILGTLNLTDNEGPVATITAANTIQIADGTAGANVLIVWLDKQGFTSASEAMVSTFGKGHIDLDGQLPGSLYAILRELMGFRISPATGAAANTNIAVTGIATEDSLVAVVNLTDGTIVAANTVSITSAGNIQSTATLASKTLGVFWRDVSSESTSESMVSTFGKGHIDLDGQLPGSLDAILREVQGLKVIFLESSAVTTTAITTGDSSITAVAGVLYLAASDTVAPYTPDQYIVSSAGVITLPSGNTFTASSDVAVFAFST